MFRLKHQSSSGEVNKMLYKTQLYTIMEKTDVDDVCSAAISTELDEFQKHDILTVLSSRFNSRLKRRITRNFNFWMFVSAGKIMGNWQLKYIVNQLTQKDIYLSDSHRPILHKKAIVRSLRDRDRTAPSSSQERAREMSYLPCKTMVIQNVLLSRTANQKNLQEKCLLPNLWTGWKWKQILRSALYRGNYRTHQKNTWTFWYQSSVRTSPDHWKSVPKAERPYAKSWDSCADL